MRIIALLLLLCPSAALAQRVDPPADQDKQYITVLGQAQDPTYQTLTRWFSNELKPLRDTAHFTAIPAESAMFDRYATSTPVLPCVRLQDAGGRVLREFAGPEVPRTWQELGAGLLSGECRPCRPAPQPEPAPAPDPEPQPIVLPAPAPPKPQTSWLTVALAALTGAGGGVLKEWRARKQ